MRRRTSRVSTFISVDSVSVSAIAEALFTCRSRAAAASGRSQPGGGVGAGWGREAGSSATWHAVTGNLLRGGMMCLANGKAARPTKGDGNGFALRVPASPMAMTVSFLAAPRLLSSSLERNGTVLEQETACLSLWCDAPRYRSHQTGRSPCPPPPARPQVKALPAAYFTATKARSGNT